MILEVVLALSLTFEVMGLNATYWMPKSRYGTLFAIPNLSQHSPIGKSTT